MTASILAEVSTLFPPALPSPNLNLNMPPSSTSTSSTPTVTAANVRLTSSSPVGTPPTPSDSGIPVTPAVLRSIFASSRTALEERSISRVAFFRFTGFILSCLAISLAAARGRGIKSGAALLGVV